MHSSPVQVGGKRGGRGGLRGKGEVRYSVLVEREDEEAERRRSGLLNCTRGRGINRKIMTFLTCLFHMSRSLGRLQPKEAEAVSSGTAPISSHSFGGIPKAPPARLASDHREERRPTNKAVPLGASFSQDAVAGVAARERAAFELMVLAVGAAVAPKLAPGGGEHGGGSWGEGSGGDEASSSWGEGDGGGEDRCDLGGDNGGGAPPPPLGLAGALAAIPLGLAECGVWDSRLLIAWERACLTPLAPRPPPPPSGVSRDPVYVPSSKRRPKWPALSNPSPSAGRADAPAQYSAVETRMHRMAPPSPSAGGAVTAPTTVVLPSATVGGSTAATLMYHMAPRHLAAVAAGLGAMRLVPGAAWQAAFFDALLHRLHRSVLKEGGMCKCVDFRKCGALCSPCCSADCTSCRNSFWGGDCVPWSSPPELSTTIMFRVEVP